MDYTKLITTIAGLGLEYGPELVKDVATLFHQDPTATVDQINAKVLATLDQAKKTDASIGT